jgi:hypothetical protein
MTVLDSQDDISNDVGWIYVMSNQAFPELLKVGYTLGDPKDRVRELSSSTAVPHPFEIDFLFVCENPQEVEQKVHRRLHAHRVNPQREFFRTSSDLLQTTILSVIYDADFSAAEGDIYLIGAAMVVEAFRVMVRHPDRFKQVDAQDPVRSAATLLKREFVDVLPPSAVTIKQKLNEILEERIREAESSRSIKA